ncbi:DUF924 family protein [Pseudomonas sp. Marseille-QA0892]
MTPWAPLLEWWFGPADTIARLDATAVSREKHKLWFGYRARQDAEARERFGVFVQEALAGRLVSWRQEPQGWLAEILLLDQLPRMLFRNTPKAFSGDASTLALARKGIDQGWHQTLPPIAHVFVYLPFEHDESAASQAMAVEYFTALAAGCRPEDRKVFADFLDYARRHQDVIRRFGRFPHRNAILGRPSTPEEVAYLSQPGLGF